MIIERFFPTIIGYAINENINNQTVEKFASKIVQGVNKLKIWSTT